MVIGKKKREKKNRPCNEERLRQAVVNVDNEVVIGDGVDFRPGKLPIDQNTLQKQTKIPLTFQSRNHTIRTFKMSRTRTLCLMPRGYISPYVTFHSKNL